MSKIQHEGAGAPSLGCTECSLFFSAHVLIALARPILYYSISVWWLHHTEAQSDIRRKCSWVCSCRADLMMLCLLNSGVREGEATERAQPAEGLYVRAMAEPLLPVPASVSRGAGHSAARHRLGQHRPHVEPAVTVFWRGLVSAQVARGTTEQSCSAGGAGGQAAWARGVRSGTGEARLSAGARIRWRSM